MYRELQWQRTACPLPSHQQARAVGDDEDKGLRLACISSQVISPRRAGAGSSRREDMIMTQNKAQKTAARQRMAETGEPYSVARRAVAAGRPDAVEDRQSAIIDDPSAVMGGQPAIIDDPSAVMGGQPASSGVGQPARTGGEPVLVRYRLSRTFELEIGEDTWTGADDNERARLIAEGADGPAGPGTTLAELIAADLREPGARACTVTAASATRDWEDASSTDWEEQYYADGAASEGIAVAEFKARQAPYRADQHADLAQAWADRAQQQAEQAQERAEQAQERAEQAQERAEQAQERAEQAQERAEQAEGRAMEARDRADEMRDLADEARDDVIAASEEGDREELAQAERAVIRAVREAELADREADRARELADQAQALADREQQRADQEQERADREQERADDLDDRPHHPRPGMFRPPSLPPPVPQMRLPRAPRLPRLPRPPRLPRLPL
jgi:hypothetical protein